MNVAIPLIPKYRDLHVIQFLYRKKFSFQKIVLFMSRKTFSHFSLSQLSKIGICKIGGEFLTREKLCKKLHN